MQPVNKHATKEACALLTYLYQTAGNKIITGQHTQTVPMEERSHIHEITGRYPKLQGFELLSYSSNINYEDASEECLTEVQNNRNTVETALQWARSTGGIVSFCFHWFSPIGGSDKSFYTIHTDFDPSRVLMDGTPERTAFYRDLDVIAIELRRFQKENIPILWRPFHEADGDWFWWGSKGHAVGRELYKLMFDYFVNVQQLEHLLWVWNSPVKEGYPGDDYVDVISRDIYLEPHTVTDYQKEYEELVANTSRNKVAALAEVGVIPDIDMLEQSRLPWAYYMTWSGEFCLTEEHNNLEALQKMYASDYAVSMK